MESTRFGRGQYVEPAQDPAHQRRHYAFTPVELTAQPLNLVDSLGRFRPTPHPGSALVTVLEEARSRQRPELFTPAPWVFIHRREKDNSLFHRPLSMEATLK